MNTGKITIADAPEMLKIAEAAAQEAGNYLIRKRGQARVKGEKSSRDSLLDVDLEAEKIILTNLRKQTPNVGIVSEEKGCEGDQEQYWIIDPLDGSANFQHENPTFAVAIALIVKENTIGSVIYLPTREETFTAIQSQGACLNGKPIRVSQTARLEDAMIHIGDIMKEGDLNVTKERLQDVSKLFTRAQRIRMIGTAATDLAYVACGRADALVNHAKDRWDIEAGKLLLTEAGGKATIQHDSNKGTICVFSNGILHDIIENLLFS